MAKTHDIRKWVLVIGSTPITGFAEGDAFSLDFDTDDWNLTVGADGEAARSYIPNQAGILTINLMATSVSNDSLNSARLIDEATALGQFPAMIKNINGTASWSAAQAWVVAPASVSVGQDVGSREWKIQSGLWVASPGNGGQPLPF